MNWLIYCIQEWIQEGVVVWTHCPYLCCSWLTPSWAGSWGQQETAVGTCTFFLSLLATAYLPSFSRCPGSPNYILPPPPNSWKGGVPHTSFNKSWICPWLHLMCKWKEEIFTFYFLFLFSAASPCLLLHKK